MTLVAKILSVKLDQRLAKALGEFEKREKVTTSEAVRLLLRAALGTVRNLPESGYHEAKFQAVREIKQRIHMGASR
jgi:metal-responsive CopG/Arc/MetJ family transcriptional regulator